MVEKRSSTAYWPAASAVLRFIGPWGTRFLRPVLAVAFLILALRAIGWVNLHGFKTAGDIFVVFVFLAYLASLARGLLRDGLIVAASLTLGLAGLEALAVKSETTSFAVVGKGFYALRPEIGWGASGPGAYPARKSDTQTDAVIYDVTYTIDDSRLRKTESLPSGPTVAFFGDSFTFGEGVDDSETMPQAFADLAERRFRVANLGFPGYGPHQVLRGLETGIFDEALGPDMRLLVLMTVPWHAERTACKPIYTLRAPRYRLRDEGIAYDGACTSGLNLAFREWAQNTALYRVAIDPYRHRVDHDEVELYIRIVLAAVELTRTKYGAATLIPYIPTGEDYLRGSGFTDDSIVERFRRGGAMVIDASLAKEAAAGAVIAIPGDGHPTALAHRARAEAIFSYLAGALPDPGLPSPR